jgi:hypothetical protein
LALLVDVMTARVRTRTVITPRGFFRDQASGSATVAAPVPISASVPTMVVVEPAAIAFPETGNKLPSIVIRLNPVRAAVRRSRPVAPVPHVA